MKAYVMVGAPGAGKSTLASKLARSEQAVIISGDEVRAELFGDEPNRGTWTEIDDRIEELLSEAVGRTVILDGTHCLVSDRSDTLALLRSYGYDEIVAIVVDTSLEECILRNATRSRHVPRHVLTVMHKKLQKSLRSIDSEGFNLVRYV
jgi:predicted kinase